SIASAPDGSHEVEFTIERLDGGEVSMFLHDVVVPGDELEVRGPIGGWFVWDGATPALPVGGGSGVVPLPGPETAIVYTRQAPDAARRPVGRPTAEDLSGLALPDTTAYVC